VGYHVNLIALRVDVRGATSFAALVRQVREVFLLGLKHSRAGVDEVFPGSYETMGAQRQPLFRHMYNYYAVEPTDWADEAGGAIVEVGRPTSRLDLELSVNDSGAETVVRAVYSDELFARSDIDALLDRLDTLLERAGHEPEAPLTELSVLTEADRALVEAAEATGTGRIAVIGDDGVEAPPGVYGTVHGFTGHRGRLRLDGSLEKVVFTPEVERTGDASANADVVEYLVGRWQEILDRPELGADANFFRHSGTSLMAVRLLGQIKKHQGVRLTLRDFFRAPTPAKLAAVVAEHTSRVPTRG
jgi:hypothetical protein